MRIVLKVLGFFGLMLAAGFAFIYFHDLILHEQKMGRGEQMSDAQFFIGLGFLGLSLVLTVLACIQIFRSMKWLSLVGLFLALLVFIPYGLMFTSVDRMAGTRPDLFNVLVILLPIALAACPVINAWLVKSKPVITHS